MKCWICGADGTTGEHLIKASDIAGYFGDFDQRNPIYFHTEKKRNIPVGSKKSDRFKSDARICNPCNSARTQPYDEAWDVLSAYLRKNSSVVGRFGKIYLKKVFPNKTRASAKSMHLFFVKQFGCRIVENNINIDTTSFSEALINNTIHRNVFIAFHREPSDIDYAEVTKIHVQYINGEVSSAFWHYYIGDFLIRILYLTNTGKARLKHGSWNPVDLKRSLSIELGPKINPDG